jgi:hypothetical protein
MQGRFTVGTLSIFVFLALLSFGHSQAHAAIITVPLDQGGDSSGWVAQWEDFGVTGVIDINVDNVILNNPNGDDRVIIEKGATFFSPPSDGVFPPVIITFKQVAADAVPLIVINDEILNNETGVTWTDFHMELIDHGDAWFDEQLTNASNGGDGFSIFPFTQQSFSPAGPNPTKFDIFGGGTIPDGTSFFPGNGPFDGELFIRTRTGTGEPGDPFTIFALKEFPTIPEPSTLALAAFGLLGTGCRRRKRV